MERLVDILPPGGEDLDAKHKNGWSAFHCQHMTNFSSWVTIRSSETTVVRDSQPYITGSTALRMSVIRRNLHLSRCPFELGVDVGARDNCECSIPLHLSAQVGSEELLQLLGHAAEVDAR